MSEGRVAGLAGRVWEICGGVGVGGERDEGGEEGFGGEVPGHECGGREAGTWTRDGEGEESKVSVIAEGLGAKAKTKMNCTISKEKVEGKNGED